MSQLLSHIHGINLEFAALTTVFVGMVQELARLFADIPSSVWEQIAAAGLPAVLMAAAVWWLQRSNSALVTELNKERGERLDAMETHIAECDKDRKELRDMLIKHLASE